MTLKNNPRPFTDILVATDFGPAAQRAADLGCDLANTYDARLSLIHVWTVPIPSYAESMTLRLDEIETEARKAMDQEVARLGARCPIAKLKTSILVGLAWRTIVESVEEQRFDLVILGTHGRHGVERFFLGSVAERVVRACKVPVLTTHASDD